MQELHIIILQCAQESYPYDDRHFTTKMAALQNRLEPLVKKHFSANHKTNWKEYYSVQEPDDREIKPTSQRR